VEHPDGRWTFKLMMESEPGIDNMTDPLITGDERKRVPKDEYEQVSAARTIIKCKQVNQQTRPSYASHHVP
jgi:hypothetical protein